MNAFLKDIYKITVNKLGDELEEGNDPQETGFELGFKAASFLLMGTNTYEDFLEKSK